jgi:CofD-related protein of GAK system
VASKKPHFETKHGPVVEVELNHPTHLPVYKKVQRYARHPKEAPPIALLSGGSGARKLSEQLIRFTHHSSHILPVFDDGGSSRELRLRLGMPPPGDLRNRLMALSDLSQSGNPEVAKLFRTRLPRAGSRDALQRELEGYLLDDHPQMTRIEPRYRRIIQTHLKRFVNHKPEDFDLSGGSLGNFVIAGSYLAVGDLESVIFEFSQLTAALGTVIPVCTGAGYHLQGRLADGQTWVGQSRLTSEPHRPIRELRIVHKKRGQWVAASPVLNPLAERAIRKASVIAYSMGSFYTSVVSSLLVDRMGEVVRSTRRPKVFIANLVADQETPGMRVSEMLQELARYLESSDSEPGELSDYVNYVLVNDHGMSDAAGHVPVDMVAIRELGVEPIVLPLEGEPAGTHDAELVASVLMSLC